MASEERTRLEETVTKAEVEKIRRFGENIGLIQGPNVPQSAPKPLLAT